MWGYTPVRTTGVLVWIWCRGKCFIIVMLRYVVLHGQAFLNLMQRKMFYHSNAIYCAVLFCTQAKDCFYAETIHCVVKMCRNWKQLCSGHRTLGQGRQLEVVATVRCLLNSHACHWHRTPAASQRLILNSGYMSNDSLPIRPLTRKYLLWTGDRWVHGQMHRQKLSVA